MVRNIAGVLMAIGRGEASVDWTREVLEVRDRRLGGVTAQPQGLYFVRADYPHLSSGTAAERACRSAPAFEEFDLRRSRHR
jgi:tRNA pseudouridine38-40 synthase